MSRTSCIVTALAIVLLLAATTWWFGQLDLSPLEIYGIEPDALKAGPGFYFVLLPAIVASVFLADRTRSVPQEQKCKWIVGTVIFFPITTCILLYRIVRDRGSAAGGAGE